MRRIYILISAISFLNITQAQIKIGDNPATINSSSILEMESNNKGLLLPRVALSSTSSFAPLASHVAGMTVYNTAIIGDVTPGYYYNDGSQWVRISDANKEPWYGVDDNGPATLNTEDIYAMGKIGIGITAPSSKLDVHQTNATGSVVKLSAGSTANNLEVIGVDASTIPASLSGLVTKSSNLIITTPRDRNLIMQLQGNDNTDGFHIINRSEEHVFTVNEEKNVGVGVHRPTNAFHVSRNIASGSPTPGVSEFVAKFENNEDPVTADAPVVWIQGGQNTYSSNSELIRFARPNGARIGGVRQSGTTTVSFSTTSDGRLKTNVQNLTDGLNIVTSMRPVSYNWKEDPKGKGEIGFIAQELYKVYPNAVIKGNDDDVNDPYQVDYSKLTPVLVQAIQEQQDKIEALSRENNIMKDQLKVLQKQVILMPKK